MVVSAEQYREENEGRNIEGTREKDHTTFKIELIVRINLAKTYLFSLLKKNQKLSYLVSEVAR